MFAVSPAAKGISRVEHLWLRRFSQWSGRVIVEGNRD
jgi:hypothetical protein